MAEVTVAIEGGGSLKVTTISGGFKFEKVVNGNAETVGTVIMANAPALRDFFDVNVPKGGKGGVTPL